MFSKFITNNIKNFIHRLYIITTRMFKELSAFFKSNNGISIIVVIIVLFSIWLLMSYSSSKTGVSDNMYTVNTPSGSAYAQVGRSKYQPANVAASAGGPLTASAQPGNYSAQPVANPQDLLPQDKNSQWAALNPVNNGNPQIPDLLQAGNLIGLDTIGQTLKNANLQLRSDPIIVKQDVGPWNQSTYEPDLGRVPLELGNCGGK